MKELMMSSTRMEVGLGLLKRMVMRVMKTKKRVLSWMKMSLGVVLEDLEEVAA